MRWKAIKLRLDAYERLLRLDKPVGIYLLLWPTLWAVVSAYQYIGIHPAVLWVFILGTVLMRSAGCAINDFADRHFDGQVARTRQRPLAQGVIQPWEALVLAAILSLMAFLLILPLNRLTLMLSVPALLLAGSYPFTKRFLAIPQAYLGLAFGFGIPMAFAAVQNGVPKLAWALFACNVCWTIAYDTAYAMVDKEDDLKIGIRTSAITFGRHEVLAMVLCQVLFLGGMLAIGVWQRWEWPYFVAWIIAALIAAVTLREAGSRVPARCFRAFLDNHWVGFVLLLGMVAQRYVGDFSMLDAS